MTAMVNNYSKGGDMNSNFNTQRIWLLIICSAGVFLSGCGSALNRAPVEDRRAPSSSSSSSSSSRAMNSVPDSAMKSTPVNENAGKPGYYSVKPGDTLIRIGLDSGQSYKDISRWNNIENPNKIEVGQVLRVVPPVTEEAATKPVTQAKVASTPLPPAAPASAASNNAAKPAVAATQTNPSNSTGAEEDISFAWPSKGEVIANFDESKNRKGLDIAGNSGDPILSAADGKVVYSGEGLRGYGKLIIIKHNNTFLTAYAHNNSLLVKEDQVVKRGQRIAEMGNTDADRVKLHFEVRKLGKPVDPVKYLASQ